MSKYEEEILIYVHFFREPVRANWQCLTTAHHPDSLNNTVPIRKPSGSQNWGSGSAQNYIILYKILLNIIVNTKRQRSAFILKKKAYGIIKAVRMMGCSPGPAIFRRADQGPEGTSAFFCSFLHTKIIRKMC